MTSPDLDQAIHNVRDYVARCKRSDADLARAVGCDDKTVRLTQTDRWNPTADMLRKFLAILPDGWTAGDPVPEPDSKSKAA